MKSLRLFCAGLALSALMSAGVANAQATYTFSTDISSAFIEENYQGTTAGGPTWQRPFASLTGLSGIGNGVTYSTHTFTPATSASYTFLSFGTDPVDWDNFLFLYEGSFNPLDQLTNGIAGNDDAFGIGSAGFGGIALTGGTDYILVTTGFAPGDEGEFDNFIINEGTFTAIPDDDPTGVTLNLPVGLGGEILSFESVELVGLSHTWIGDLTVTLSNGIVTVPLLNRLGVDANNSVGESYNLDGDYTFANGGAALPTGLGSGDVLTPGTYAPFSSLSAFNGQQLGGNWQLFISDGAFLDEGGLLGFRFTVQAVPEPGTYAMLIGAGLPLGLLALRRRVRK